MSGRADDFGGLGRGGVTSYRDTGGFIISKKYVDAGSDGGVGITITDGRIQPTSICVATYNTALIPTGASNYVTACFPISQHQIQIYWSTNTSAVGDNITYFIATEGSG